MKTIRLFISGTVQGVNFRYFLKQNADRLLIKGYARNLDDGRVEVLIEGSIDNTKEMIEVCKKGPIGSRVKDVQFNEISHQGFDNFKIL